MDLSIYKVCPVAISSSRFTNGLNSSLDPNNCRDTLKDQVTRFYSLEPKSGRSGVSRDSLSREINREIEDKACFNLI